jgi:MFS family permease
VGRRNGDLRRYLVAATASRTADEGLAPALALVVAATGREPALAGALLAAVGLPHLVAGPLAGAALDASGDRRALLALAPAVVGAALAAIALALGHVPDAFCVVLAAAAGCFGPLLTGGLSAELTQLVRGEPGRALAYDGATYNVAGVAGPSVVAATAALAGAVPAALCLAVLAVCATAAVLSLPAGEAPRERRRLRVGASRRLWEEPTLRAVTAGTTIAFAGAGALPILVIARAEELGSATAGAALLAVMAAGALAGSLLLAARARGGRPERRVTGALVVVGLALAVAAVAPALGALGAGLALAGVADGVLFPALLAVRTARSRREERGAVFTTAASVKIGAAAGGAALGGLLVTEAGATAALLAVAALQLAGAAVCAAAR